MLELAHAYGTSHRLGQGWGYNYQAGWANYLKVVHDLGQTKKLLKTVDNTISQSSNGATLMPEFDLGISNNEDGTVTPFKRSASTSASPSIPTTATRIGAADCLRARCGACAAPRKFHPSSRGSCPGPIELRAST